MLSTIIHFSVRNKLVVGLFTMALVIWGVLSLQNLPIDAVPDITNNQVQVITVSPSLAAPEVERLITFPIEQSTSTIPGIREMRSFSRFGLSLVTIVFNDNVDVYWARQQISERLQEIRTQIPADAGNPSLAPVTTGLGEIFQYAVKPKKGYEGKYSATELRTIQDWIVRRQLMGTPGVADVSSFGGFLKQYEVAVDLSKLKSLHLTVADVFAALQTNNQNTGGSYIEKGPAVLFIRTEGLTKTIEDIQSIPVRYTPGGAGIYIRDVADVRIGHATRYGAMLFNDDGEVAGAVVMMLKGENSSAVIKAVKERIVQIQKNLPEGVVIEPFLDRTKMVNHAIGTVKTNLLEGALIVILVLVLFLGNLRAGLIVASVIPLSMLFAIIMMNLLGVSGNLMSLGALDFGLIVDGAVIIVEAVMHRLYHNKIEPAVRRYSQDEMDQAVESSAGKMMGAAVFGQIIILIVYLPILSLVGIEGKMFKPMAQTVSFALIGAFLLSLTYVPMITSLVLNKNIKQQHNLSDRAIEWLQSKYQPLLKRALAIPRTLVAIAMLLFGLAAFLLSTLGGEFIPELEEGDFAVDTRVLTGSSLTTSIEATTQAAGILKKQFPEIEKVVTKIGSGEIPTDPMPLEAADMMVILKDKSEWTSARSFDELANKMSIALQQVPGIAVGFQFPVQMRFNELMTGARQDVVCKIFGEDLDSLAYYNNMLGSIIRSVEGARDLYLETVTGLPQIVITYKRSSLAMYQLNVEEVNRLVQAAFAGADAGLVYENERRFNLVVRVKDALRKDAEDVRNMLIPLKSGEQVPLYAVADVAVKEGPNQIQREEARRRIVAGFNVRGRDVQSIVEELQKKVTASIKLPPGYFITYGGQFENLVEAKKRLSIAVPAALLLILLMLYFAFGSVKYGLLIFSAIPLSAIGGVFALWGRGMPFSISAGVGFIALFGVAVLNGIVLISEFNRLKKSGLQDVRAIILQGTALRLRPVLMTAAVASLGFVPMALSNGAGAEVQRPLATVVIGGLITATFLTLFVLPVLYAWFEKATPRKMKISTSVPVLLCLFFSGTAFGQSAKRSLDELQQLAVKQNLSLRSASMQADYWKALGASTFDPAKTQFGVEYGKVNSFNNDTRFNLIQGFNLPVVYKRQATLYEANRSGAMLAYQVQQREIERQVAVAFYSLVDLLERRKMLIELDSVYIKFAGAADRRLSAGEANLIEQTTAQAHAGQIRWQLESVRAEIGSQQRTLQLLTNAADLVEPDYSDPLAVLQSIADTSALAGHPMIAWQRQQEQIARAASDVERNRLSPDFNIGYSNQSFVGWQSKDGVSQQYLSSSNRFNLVQAGIGIPIFSGATRARIRASEVNAGIARTNAELTEKQVRNAYTQASERLRHLQQVADHYATKGLAQSNTIVQQAQLAFTKGNIDFLQWSQLMTQAYEIRVNYLDAVKAYNLAVAELDFYLSK